MCVNFAPLLKVTVASVHFHFRKVRFFCPQLFVWTVTRKAALDIIYSDPYVESKHFGPVDDGKYQRGRLSRKLHTEAGWWLNQPIPKILVKLGIFHK